MTGHGTRIELDLSGLSLRLEGVPQASAVRLKNEWRAFRADTAGAAPFLRVCVRSSSTSPASDAPFAPKRMRSRLTRDSAVFSMPEGRAEVALSGPARIELSGGLGEREYFTLLNLLRSSLAWRLPSRPAALLHAAGAVVDGRAFVLTGAEGTGKSTWAHLAEQAGARIVSDDLVLLDASTRGFDLLGAPFRSTHRTQFRKGRWPLAAILFPAHGAAPSLASVAPIVAKARITANLPFIAEAVEHDERVTVLVDRLASEIACAELTFAPDPGFVRTLRDWPKTDGGALR